jgi:ACR3 family arsenite transporter
MFLPCLLRLVFFCAEADGGLWSLAIGLLVMMYPILCKVRYETLHLIVRSRALWVQIAFSIFMNWIVAPLLMVCLCCTAL